MSPAYKDIKVFFGCSMRGGYGVVSKEDLAKVPGIIRTLGCGLASDHQTLPGILERERALTAAEIHDRDYAWLLESDVAIFEISNPSLGAGGEIADIIHMGKPVLLLYRYDVEESVSAYTRGKQGSRFISSPVECCAYRDVSDLRDTIQAFIDRHFPKAGAIGI